MRLIQVNKAVGDVLCEGLAAKVADKQLIRDGERTFTVRRDFFVSTGLGRSVTFKKDDIVEICPQNFLDFFIIGEVAP